MLRWMDLCRRGMLAFQSRNEDIQMNRAQPDTEMKRSEIEVAWMVSQDRTLSLVVPQSALVWQ